MSKSEKIREYLASHPTATAADVVKALKKARIKVSLPLIYQQLSKAKEGSRPAKPSSEMGQVSVDSLIEAKKLVSQAGSVTEAARALDILAELTS